MDAIERLQDRLGKAAAAGFDLALPMDQSDLREIVALASRDPEAAKLEMPASVKFLRVMVEEQIAREGETSSFMVRAGLLLDIIDTALGAANTPEQQG